jgi:hypothetical protein
MSDPVCSYPPTNELLVLEMKTYAFYLTMANGYKPALLEAFLEVSLRIVDLGKELSVISCQSTLASTSGDRLGPDKLLLRSQ